MTHNQIIGRRGENAAAAYLQEHGYEIVERNARTPHGEIDLVARREDITYFVEVKTRTSRRLGLPEEAVTPKKRAAMFAAGRHYAAVHEIDYWQADVLAVEELPGRQPVIEHFENVLA
jgi:putative endonuclease